MVQAWPKRSKAKADKASGARSWRTPTPGSLSTPLWLAIYGGSTLNCQRHPLQVCESVMMIQHVGLVCGHYAGLHGAHSMSCGSSHKLSLDQR
eukprot:3097971-Amphidinium_carterae.1